MTDQPRLSEDVYSYIGQHADNCPAHMLRVRNIGPCDCGRDDFIDRLQALEAREERLRMLERDDWFQLRQIIRMHRYDDSTVPTEEALIAALAESRQEGAER